jgi:hypothetical protein
MSERFGHLATWFPDTRVRLGDVGVLQGGRFFQKKTLEDLQIPFKVRAGSQGGDWDHSSGSDVQVQFSAATPEGAAAVPGGHAVVTFGSTGAFLFQAIDCRTETIENMADVGQEIVSAYRGGVYDREWIVIDRVVRARSATVLVSDSAGAEIELGADVPLAALPSLADASIGVKAKRWRGEVTRFVATSALTPLFGASKLRGLFRPRVGPVRSAEPEPVLGALTIEEQL